MGGSRGHDFQFAITAGIATKWCKWGNQFRVEACGPGLYQPGAGRLPHPEAGDLPGAGDGEERRWLWAQDPIKKLRSGSLKLPILRNFVR